MGGKTAKCCLAYVPLVGFGHLIVEFSAWRNAKTIKTAWLPWAPTVLILTCFLRSRAHTWLLAPLIRAWFHACMHMHCRPCPDRSSCWNGTLFITANYANVPFAPIHRTPPSVWKSEWPQYMHEESAHAPFQSYLRTYMLHGKLMILFRWIFWWPI